MPVDVTILAPGYLAEGGESLINSTTLNSQHDPSIAMLADGGYVVSWTSGFQDGSGLGVYAQRYDAAGVPQGGETRVNTTIASEQTNSAVTALADGGYVVAWMSLGQDGSSWGIFTQRFDAAGVAQGGETQVNTTSANAQFLPAIASLAGGGYVVTWQSLDQDGSNFGIYAQRYDSAGAPAGGEFRINSTTVDTQQGSTVTGLAGGGFVVAWESANQDGSGFGIYLQRYDASGVAQGGETRVNTTIADQQGKPSIAALTDGGFVVAWESGHSLDSDIYVQRFDALGAPIGAETRANTGLADVQRFASVGSLDDGGFVVAWESVGQDGSGFGIYAQRFDASGAPQGAETRVNTFTAGDQLLPSVAGLAGGDYLIGWSSADQDGSIRGVYTQRYGGGFPADEQVPLSLKGSIQLEDSGASNFTLTLSTDFGILNVAAGTSGASVSGSGTSRVTVSGTFAQLQALLDSDPGSVVDYVADSDAPPPSATLTVQIDDGATQAGDSDTIVITPVNDAPTVSILVPAARTGGEVLVNTATEGNQLSQQLAAQADGSFVIVWTDEGLETGPAIKLQAFDPAGTRIGGETVLAETTDTSLPDSPLITALEGGGYVITWVEFSLADGQQVKARLIDAGGSPTGAEFLVNVATAADQEPEAVVALDGGGFVVVWRDSSQGIGGAAGDSSGFAVKARVYDASGVPAGGEILVNTAVFNSQINAQAVALPGVGFVVTWADLSQGLGGTLGDSSFSAVKSQLFDLAGAPIGGEILVNTHTHLPQVDPKLTALAHGGFVISWVDESGTSPGDASGDAVKAQVFDSDGDKVGSEIAVNSATAGIQEAQQIVALSGGGFVIVWNDHSAGIGGAAGDNSSLAVKAQIFDDAGARIGSEILVNTATELFQYDPQIVALTDGRFVVAWNDGSNGVGGAAGDSSIRAVKAQLFEADGTRVGGEILVNSATHDRQDGPLLVALPDGGWAVTWQDESEGVGGATGDTSFRAVKAQVFGAYVDATEQVVLDLKGQIGVDDPDAGTAVLTGTLSVGYGILSLTVGGSGAVVVSGNGTGTVTLSGTLAQLNALLAGDATSTILYTPDTDAPPPRTVLTFSVNDGGASGVDPGLSGGAGDEVGTASATIAIAAVNDAPVLALPSSLSTVEGAPALFAGALFIDPPPTVVSDADSSTLTVSIAVADGTLSTFNSAGATVTGAGTNALTLSGTVAQVNQALYAAVYTPAAGVSGVRTVTVTASDGLASDVETITINIADVAIEPVGQDVSRSTPIDVNLLLTTADFPFTDLDGDTLAGVLLTTLPQHGRLINTAGIDDSIDVTGDGVPDIVVRRQEYRLGDEISRADLDAGLVFYDPDAGATGTDGFTFQVRDAGGSLGVNVDQTPNSFAIALDQFALARDDALATAENAVLAGSVLADNGSGVDADPDTTALQVAALNGSAIGIGTPVTLDSGALLTLNADGTFSYDPNHAFDYLAAPGSGASNIPGLDQFTYTLAGGGTATVTIAIIGVDSADSLMGSPGADTLRGGVDDDGLSGLGGDDVLSGGPGDDGSLGGAGNDVHAVDSAGDVPMELPGEGNDRVLAYTSFWLPSGSEIELLAAANQRGTDALNLAGNDLGQTIIGNDGANTLRGLDGRDVLYGVAGNDMLLGGTGDDTMFGGLGDDLFSVDSAHDQVIELAGQGSDRVLATVSYTLGSGMDIELLATANQAGTAAINLTGNDLGNNIQANQGANVLTGGASSDTLWGVGGHDTLNGGDGSDLLIGGDGADDYLFTNVLGRANVDLIRGFAPGSDRILLDDAIFSRIAPGTLADGAFQVGTAAQDAEDRILYDQTTGNLFYDADGSGAGAAILFARLEGAPVIAAGEFAVI